MMFLHELQDENDWNKILKYVFKKADKVAFNILYNDQSLQELFSQYENSVIEPEISLPKGYSSGKSIFFKVSDKMKDFVMSKSFKDWKNSPLEDISFYFDDNEFLYTITHEGYIIADDDTKNALSELGIGFSISVSE